MLSPPGGGHGRRKNLPASNPISIPSISNISSNCNLNWSLPPSSPLSPLNSHHTASPPTDLPVDIRPGSPTSLLSVPMPTPSPAANSNFNSNSNSPLSPVSPAPSTELSSPETIQFALPSDIEPERSDSDEDKQRDKPSLREKWEQKWDEAEQRLGGYASDSPSGIRTKHSRRMLPPLLMLNHKRSSSSSLLQHATSLSSSTSPLSSHSRFHSQSTMSTLARDSFIDLEDTFEEGITDSPNAMYPAPPKRNVGGLFRHKQTGSLRSIASASSLLPTFADPITHDASYQALAPPSPGLNVPFGVSGAAHTSTSPGATHAWKMFSRGDKEKDKSAKKKDLPWRSSPDDAPSGGTNIPSTSSSPTRPSASSLKPPKLKYHKKGKSKSHTHPLDYASSSPSTPILPSAEPLPLPFPLPLPPTTNNLGPAERQELIKKHRKLAKVLGEEPRVVGHLEFMGGSAFISGKGAGLSVHSTSASLNSTSHHGTSASMSISPSGSNALGTFLHLNRKQKQKDKDDWESGWDDENKSVNNAKGGKGKPQVSSWDVISNGVPEATHLHHTSHDNTNEIISVLDGAYQQIIQHNSTNAMARRHSTPVTGEFLLNGHTENDAKREERKKNRDQPRMDEKNKNKRSKDHGDLQHRSPSTRSNIIPSNPILISPTSPVPSAPTIRSLQSSIPDSPISDVFSPPSSVRDRPSDQASISKLAILQTLGDDNALPLTSHTSLVSPSSSTPPILPPLTTSPPRLRIDAGLFQNPDPSLSYSPKRAVESILSLAVDENKSEELNARSAAHKVQETGKESTDQAEKKNPDSQALQNMSSTSHTQPHPLVIPLSSKSHNSSRPSTPHSLVRLRDRGPVTAAISSPVSTTSGLASSALSAAASASVETLKPKPRTKDKSREKTRRTPVGPSTFPTPATPTTESEDREERKERDRKDRHRRTHVRTRSESPESFMDMEDDEIENGSKISIRGNEVDHHQAQRSQGMFIKASLNSKADTNSVAPRSPLPPSPLSTMSLSASALGDPKAKVMLDVPSGAASQVVHRTPSLVSLTTSIDDLYAYSHDEDPLSLSEQDKRKKMDKIAKLNRFLGDPVPIELVLGDSYAFKNVDLPPLAMVEGVGLVSGSKRPIWMRRRRSSSSAALPGYEGRKEFAESERRKDDLDSKERIKHVRRGVKMEQMFGTRPPPDLYQVHVRGINQSSSSSSVPNPRERLPGSPISPTSPRFQGEHQPKGNMNSSAYKNKSRHSGLGYSTLGHNNSGSTWTGPVVGGIDYAYANAHPQAFDASLSLSRTQSKSKGKSHTPLPLLFTSPNATAPGFNLSSQRPSTADSDKPLLAFGQDIPSGGRLGDQGGVVDTNCLDPDNRSVKSSVYMYYRQSLISLGDIVEKDDKASLAELHEYLQLPHNSSRTGLGYGYDFEHGDVEYDSEDSYDEDEEDENQDKSISLKYTFQNDDALATPTQLTPSGSRSPNTPRSANAEPSHSPSLTRRRSLPSRASTLSLVSTLSGTSTLSSLSALSNTTTAGSARGITNIPGYYNAPRTEAEGRAAVFKARRRRAAKLTNFFGVKYRDLFGEVLETIEAGMREDVRVGRMGVGELEELMLRVKKLKTRSRRNEFK